MNAVTHAATFETDPAEIERSPLEQLRLLSVAGTVPLAVFEAFRELHEDAAIAADLLEQELEEPGESFALGLVRKSIAHVGGAP